MYKKVFPKTSIKKVDVLAAKGAVNAGCYVSDGKLVPAVNSDSAISMLKEKATAAWYSGLMKKYILFTQNRIYQSTGAPNSSSPVSLMASNPSFIEVYGQTKAAYIIGDSTYYAIGTSNYSNPFKGNVFSCVLKNGRIFGIDNTNQNKIRWSGEGGIDDWTESISGAGWVTVQYGYGSILNLIVYKDTIVAVREYGLTFLSAHGTPENYKLSYLESKLPKIFKNTVAVVGTDLVFYTEDGLYIYDGNKVEKCTLPLAEEIQSPVSGTGANGKYFLCGSSKTLIKTATLFFDAMRNITYLIETAANVVAVGDEILAFSNTNELQLEEGGRYNFNSGEFDFSSSKVKVLKELIMDGAEDVELEVSNGVNWYVVEGVRGKFRPNLRGKSFKIRLSGECKINGIYAVAEVADGV